jgi:hypothetical protein
MVIVIALDRELRGGDCTFRQPLEGQHGNRDD